LVNSPAPLVPTAGVAWAGATCPNMYTVFLVMSNELSNPKIVVCPGDSDRSAPTNFYNNLTTLKNNGVSYFVGQNSADAFPQMFLSGDRNIAVDTTTGLGLGYGYSPDSTVTPGTPSAGALIALQTNAAPMNGLNFGWTGKIHQNSGNVGLADGSVQQYTMSGLKQALARTGDTTTTPGPNTILFP
jgi:prepilin-type processing-associated H-X9-DG protein